MSIDWRKGLLGHLKIFISSTTARAPVDGASAEGCVYP